MRSLRSLPSREAGFVEPMECLAVPKLPSGSDWVYEIKLDGYRALAINSKGKLNFYSRKRKSFNRQYPHILNALCELPENTMVDGEIVALDATETSAEYFKTSVDVILQSACEQGLEGVVAKRKDSRYEPGKRSGAWAKYRLNSGQELIIGGYIPGPHGVDSIIVGYYNGSNLMYVRVRSGFVPLTRRQVLARLQPLTNLDCPFTNLPEKDKGRWGTGLTAADMKKCVWVRPKVVARIKYLEWTDGDHWRTD